MRAREPLCLAVSAVLLLAGSAGAAWAQGDTVQIKPGLWRVTSQLWLDGKEILSEIDAAGARATAQVLEQARAGMSPAERADFDRNFQPPPRESAQFEMECITPAEANLSSQAALQTALASLQVPPWACNTTNARSSASGHSFDYVCRTSANARAQGQARFVWITERRYRVEIEGSSHLVDMDTGRPLTQRMVTARALTTGHWHAESCQP